MRRGGMPLPGSFFFGFFAPAVPTGVVVVGDAAVDVAVEQAQGAPLPEAHVFVCGALALALAPATTGTTGSPDALDTPGRHVTASIGATMPTLPVRQGIGSTSA